MQTGELISRASSDVDAISSAVAAFAWWRGVPSLWVALGGGLCCAALAGWGALKHKQRGSLKDACSKERRRLDQMKFAAQTRQSELSERCEAMGLPSSAIDLVRLQKLVTANQALLEAFWSGGALPTEPVDKKPPESPPIVAATAEELAGISAEAAELQQMESRLEEFAGQVRHKEERLLALQRQRDEAAAQQAPASSSGARAALVKRKREMEERIAVLRKAVDLLARAVDEYSGSHLLRLNEEVSRLFGKLTGGRHPEVRLDDNMAPLVRVDGRRWQPIEHFSRGTVDALYLALRIALARVRGDGRSLPLMLDDPFVHLDQKRLATALNLVDIAATDGQLILLSHNLELGKRAARERWHVISVDGGGARPLPEEGGDHAGQLHLL